jgi:hypothetical protein
MTPNPIFVVSVGGVECCTNQTSLQESIIAIYPSMGEEHEQTIGGLVYYLQYSGSSVSSVTVKKECAFYFGNGPCLTGEARDYTGGAINECKSSLFARPGTCSVTPEAPKGGGAYTITSPKYQGSPILACENAHSKRLDWSLLSA